MALSVFGAGVDVHAGGADLRFPHHACHAAMAEAFTGVRPYARAWLHAGTVRVGGAKMAKSAGNLARANTRRSGAGPVRVACPSVAHRTGHDVCEVGFGGIPAHPR